MLRRELHVCPIVKLTKISDWLTCGEAQTMYCQTMEGWSNLLPNFREIQTGKHIDVVAGPYSYVHRQIVTERLAWVDRRLNNLPDGRPRCQVILENPASTPCAT
jgi:hypothetical protein